jgi:predicted ribosomally synthesized peptide with nif11-like leader
MEFKDLTPEQQEKARACKTPEELLALAKAEGYELTDEELGAVSGGGAWEHVEHFLDHDCSVD